MPVPVSVSLVNCTLQAILLERLVEPHDIRRQSYRQLGIPGRENHRDHWPMQPHLFRQLRARHTWHRLVRDHQIEALGSIKVLQRLAPGMCLQHVMSEVFQHRCRVLKD
jgi:hypothetical protein